jgi:hypothetical protein
MKIKKHPTKNKAEEMLHDGTAHGHKLTAKQKRYFGMLAHKANGGEIDNPPDKYKPTDEQDNADMNIALFKMKNGLLPNKHEFNKDKNSYIIPYNVSGETGVSLGKSFNNIDLGITSSKSNIPINSSDYDSKIHNGVDVRYNFGKNNANVSLPIDYKDKPMFNINRNIKDDKWNVGIDYQPGKGNDKYIGASVNYNFGYGGYINRLPKLFDGDPNLALNGIRDPFTSSLDLGSSSYNNNFGFQHPENPGLATNDASTPNSNAPNMGVYGMAAGQAAGLVKAIGSGKGKDGTDTTGSIIGSDVLSGAAAGTAVLPGIGTAVGAGIGAIKSVFDVSSNNKLRKTIEQDKINTYNTNTQMRYNTDKANLSNFNSKGNQTNSLYANGGDLDETMDNQNNEYFRNRVNEIGLSGATKEYNDFFDITPDKGKGKKKFAMKNYAD